MARVSGKPSFCLLWTDETNYGVKGSCFTVRENSVVFGKSYLKYLVKEYVRYYNILTVHSSMGNMPSWLQGRECRWKRKMRIKAWRRD